MDRMRRPDIDWLRVAATYLLFVFHVGMVFNPAPFFHIRNADVSRFLLGMRPKMCPLRRPVALSAPAAAMLLASIVVAMPTAAAGATPVGLWYAEGGAARVAIEPCGTTTWIRVGARAVSAVTTPR